MRTIIKTIDLKLEDIPESHASSQSINKFAISFDNTTEQVDWTRVDLDSDFEYLEINELRAILYVTQRRWNHFGQPYDSITEEKIRNLIKALRKKCRP